MLSEREKKELIAAVAKECGVTISANDPVFAAVQLHALMLGRGVDLMADRVKRDLVLELKHGLQEVADDMGSKVAKRFYDELKSLSEVFHEVEDRVASEGRRGFWAIVTVTVAGLLVPALRAWGLLP